jgi:hypothetical protein
VRTKTVYAVPMAWAVVLLMVMTAFGVSGIWAWFKWGFPYDWWFIVPEAVSYVLASACLKMSRVEQPVAYHQNAGAGE